MKRSERTLVFFAIGLAAVAIAAILVAVTRGRETIALLPESNPAGVVQRYLIAIQDGDYQAAQKYLATPPVVEKPVPPGAITVVPGQPPLTPTFSPQTYVPQPVPPSPSPAVTWRATLAATRVDGQQAQVDIVIYVFGRGGPFSNSERPVRESFFLVNQGDAWRIQSPVGLWWLY